MLYVGEVAALATALFWTISAMAFEVASKRIGSLQVNILRLFFAFIIFGIITLIRTGGFFPISASSHNWLWLSISGIIGFVIGDLMLFQSYVVIGSRISMLIMSISPLIAAIFGFFFLHETLSIKNIFAIIIVILGIVFVIIGKPKTENSSKRKINIRFSIIGILLALGGAMGQALGLVFSKYGMQDYDVIMATQIRIIAGLSGYTLIFIILNNWGKLFNSFTDAKAITRLGIGSIFGPFLGVLASLISIKYTSTGIASSLMSIVPILIIPPAIIIFKEKVSIREILGACISIGGVILFFV